MRKGLEETFLQRLYTNFTNKHIEICSASLIIRKMQLKTAVWYFFTSTRMAIIKKKRRVGKDIEKLEPPCIAEGSVKWCNHCGKSLVGPQRANPRITHDPAIPFLGVCPKELKGGLQKYLFAKVNCSITQKYNPSVHQRMNG